MLSDLLPDAIKIHLASRPLARLPPFTRWEPALQTTWRNSLFCFADWLGPQLDAWTRTKNDLILLHATLNYIALPSHIIIPASRLHPTTGVFTVDLPEGGVFDLTLGHHLPPAPRPRSEAPTVSKCARDARNHLKNDRPKKAIQSL